MPSKSSLDKCFFCLNLLPPSCSVKLALDMKTKKQVAIKILKVKEGRIAAFSKQQSLESFHTEIAILSKCYHENIVKIKAASFDGTIVKELVRPD